MKTVYTIILLSFLMITTTNANVQPLASIDNTKKVIQIGMFVENLNLIDAVQKYKNKYNLFTKSYKNYKIIYAVNIDNSKVKSILKEIKKDYVDAFINHKIYFVNPKSKMLHDKVDMAKIENGQIDIIQIGMFEKEENLFDTIRKYGKTNTMMIKPYKNTYIAYLMNADDKKNKKELNIVRKSYSDAFLNTKIHLYTHPQKTMNVKKTTPKPIIITKEKIVIKYVERPKVIEKIVEKVIEKTVEKVVMVKKVDLPKVTQPVNMDSLITSFENLPFAIYGY